MFTIPIFKAEREAGLAIAIQTQAAIAFDLSIEPVEIEEAKANFSKHVLAKGGEAAHMNLYPFKSILATVGWNKNDDVFDAQETWAARATAEDQPINIEHDSTRIRGHITGQYPVNAKLERLADDLAVDELPDKFHIITSGVIYKRYENEDVQAEMNGVLDELAEGKWKVSMECLLRGFDYAVIDAKGSHSIVPRCEESAFLTKHLRAYGGEGKYQGYKVGRLLRNFSFSGKGLVKKPANPESVILAEAMTFSGSQKSFSQIFVQSGYESSTARNNTESVMQTELELLKEQLKSVTEEKNAAVASLKEFDTKKLADLEGQLKTKAEEVTSLASKLAENEKALSEAQAALTQTQKSLEEIQAKAKQVERLSAIKAGLEVSDEKATKLAESMKSLSDEAFTVAVDAMKEKMAEYKKAANEPDVKRIEEENEHGAGHPKAEGLKTSEHGHKPKEADKTLKVNDTPRQKAGGKDEASTIETATTTEESTVANTNPADAQADADATLTTAGETNEKVESTRASIADWLTKGKYIGRSRRQSQSKE